MGNKTKQHFIKTRVPRGLCLLLAVVMAFGVLPVTRGQAHAAAKWTWGYGDQLSWVMDNGTLTIKGTGSMAHGVTLTPWEDDEEKYSRDDVKEVVVEEGITDIFGFGECHNLETVHLPESLEVIGDSAFDECSALAAITIPSHVESIGSGAFHGCSALTEVTFEEGSRLASIEKAAFGNCTQLPSITLPSSVTKLGDLAFGGCGKLKTIYLSEKLQTIGFGAFRGCESLTRLRIPAQVRSIDNEELLAGCDRLTTLQVDPANTVYDSRGNCNAIIETAKDRLIAGCLSVEIPSSVKAVGSCAFYECSFLEEIRIPEGVTDIESSAFNYASSLQTIYLPASLKNIRESAFSGIYTFLYDVDVHYAGNKSQWKGITIEEDNDVFTYGQMHYSSYAPTSSDLLHAPDHKITEDELFGKYYYFLHNRTYKKMLMTLSADMKSINNKRTAWDNAYSVLISNFKSGPVTSVINAAYATVTGEYRGQDEIEKELALAYLQAMGKNKTIATDIASKVSKSMKISKSAYTLIKSSKLNAAEKKELAKALAGGVYTESEALDIIRHTETNWDKIDKVFKAAGKTVTVGETVTTIIVTASTNKELTSRTMGLIEKDTALYNGLKQVAKIQKYPAESIVEKLLEDEAFDKIADVMTEQGIGRLSSLIADTGGIEVGLATAVAEIGYYIAGSVMNCFAADADEVVKALLAVQNQGTLRSALSDKYREICENAENLGGKKISSLKSDYLLLYEAYLQSILQSVDDVSKAAVSNKQKSRLEKDYKKYKSKLTTQKYLKSCLACANATWKYTVKNGKAVISGYSSAETASVGGETFAARALRSAKGILLPESFASGSDLCIDIPEELDGYEVVGIGDRALSDITELSSVSLPDTLLTIGAGAFSGCLGLEDVYLGDGVRQIGEESFAGCSSLSELSLPAGLESIGEDAFRSIASITLTEAQPAAGADYASEYDNVFSDQEPVRVKEIRILSEPDKTRYKMSELAEPAAPGTDGLSHPVVDLDGLALAVTYTDGSSETISRGMTAWIQDKISGECPVTVSYGGCSDTYMIRVTDDTCQYTAVCVDELGRKIADPVTGTAMSGETITIPSPAVAGYIPLEDSLQVEIGADNYFVFDYISEGARMDISGIPASLEYTSTTYHQLTYYRTGIPSPRKPRVKVDGLTEGTDYTLVYSNNLTVGTAKVILTGTGKYRGSKTLTFQILPADIRSGTLKLEKSAFAYTGAAHRPDLDEFLGLPPDDYTVTYQNNVNIGTGLAIFQGRGNFTGMARIPFTILPPKAALSKVKAKKKKMAVTWKACPGGVKYQVQYRKGKGPWKTVTTSKTSLTVKKLKSKKKYTVRVRAVKTVFGKAYCGAWSAAKTVKIK